MNELDLFGLKEGNIFHVECDNGARLICIVDRITHEDIFGRAITTQERLIFSLKSGESRGNKSRCKCQIDQTRQLPAELHRIMLQIDRKYKFNDAPEGSRLLREEIYGMIMVDEFYETDEVESSH